MLKYNIRTDGSSTNEEIVYDEFYLSHDLNYISGVTSIDYNLIDGENVNLKVPFYDSLYKTQIRVKNVKRQGYVVYKQPYEIKTIEGTEYIIYNDGKIYYKGDKGFFINGGFHTGTDVLYVDTKYWVEDGFLTIDNVEYEVDLNLVINGYEVDNDSNPIYSKPIYRTPLIKLKDETILTLKNYEYNKWFKVSKFVIYKDDDFKLFLDTVTCAEYYRYISYGNASYRLKTNRDDDDNEYYMTIIDGKEYDDKDKDNLIDVNGVPCQIKYGWEGSASGEYLYLYLRDNITLHEGEFVNAISIKPTNIKLALIPKGDENYIIFNGFKYYVKKDIKFTVSIGDVECELFINGTSGYYVLDGKKYEVTVKSDEIISRIGIIEANGKVIREEVTNVFTSHSGVTIDGKVYLVVKDNYVYGSENKLGEEEDLGYVYINTSTEYKLIVDEVTSPNMVRCHPLLEHDNLTDSEKQIESGTICTNIYNNLGDYSFTLPNKMFGNEPITPKSGMGEHYMDVNSEIDLLKIYKTVDYLTLPLNFDIEVANNLFQEMVLEDEFFNVEKKNSINRIVDMEKEIYLPAYKEKEKEFGLVNEIVFNLHFRTRDLTTWKIIEDNGIEATSGMCNWFIFDSEEYKDVDYDDKLNMSDLLSFLDFTTDDVFYQKTKLSKSFIRLTFFDSKDPKTQSLLHSSTIFLDEGMLYKKYINNVKNGEFIKIGFGDEKYNSIDVNTEPVNGDEIYFDEEKRLSSRIVVKNRYESDASSEGFYLYMFKEYSKNLHEETIYMKVDFNHAGIGRTIPFMMPLNENGEIEEDVDKLKKGYPLNEIYEQMFIELKVVYDDKNKKYVYYLPSKNTKTVKKVDDKPIMSFNLFEIKIKDESENENN